jgi:hypothetical protein
VVGTDQLLSVQAMEIKEIKGEYLIIQTLNTASPTPWPRCVRRVSSAVPLLGCWAGNTPGRVCLSVVSVVCCQVEVSCDRLITRPEESCRVWCVSCQVGYSDIMTLTLAGLFAWQQVMEAWERQSSGN